MQYRSRTGESLFPLAPGSVGVFPDERIASHVERKTDPFSPKPRQSRGLTENPHEQALGKYARPTKDSPCPAGSSMDHSILLDGEVSRRLGGRPDYWVGIVLKLA